MAKVTITFEDIEDGAVKTTLNAEPPVDLDHPTEAQLMAVSAIKLLQEHAIEEV